jgi:hypothetical protein
MKTVLLALHITGGSLGVITGFTSLIAGKGSTLHRRSGQVFVGAMVTMGLTGAIMGNVVGGLVATYLVITAWTTLRPFPRRASIALMLGAACMAVLMMIDAFTTLSQGHMSKKGVPVPMTLFLATIMLLAAAGDFRLLRNRGVIKGSPRLVRHLWRMCFSLFIAAGSFFTIRKRVAVILPDPFLSFPVRLIPVVLPLLAIGYWLWRIKVRKRFKPVRLVNVLDG